jgi:hypothetical protein
MIQTVGRSLAGRFLLLALMLGSITALGERLLFAAALGRPVHFGEFDVLALNAALTAIPFLYLAFRRRILLWLVAILATVAVHGWWLAKGITYQMAPDGTGVPMFGVLLMLLSPFAILLLTGALNIAMSRRGNGSASRSGRGAA